ncbi:hypothetical protein NDU88_006531 [Pleurodeles waltl]|uniref:Secreted protein n=1 Tax=Pleurodeles waltl TaxID=8319 RepID=A0AAV7NVD9_PLEWA|nr:hypothetical protein NDU88_006531 [Pleurodeles waltl]
MALAGASLTWAAVLCRVSSSASAPSPPGLPLCRSPSLLFREASAGGRRPPPLSPCFIFRAQARYLQRVGPLLSGRSCAPNPGDLLRLGGRANSVPHAQGQARSLRSTCTASIGGRHSLRSAKRG